MTGLTCCPLVYSFGRLTTVDRDITARCLVIMNRADPSLIDYMQYTIDHTPVELGENYALAKQFGQTLLENCREMIGQPPLYRDGESQVVRMLPCERLKLNWCYSA